jgi:hypothetical protein
MGEVLPEDRDVVGVAVGHAVHADAVGLPGHARGVEQVEDHRVVEDPVAPHAVGGDPARRAGHVVEAVRPGRPELGAEEVHGQGGVLVEAVVERQVLGEVVAQRVDAGIRVEAVHRAAVDLLVDRVPAMRDVRRREAVEVIRGDAAARAVGLRPAGRRTPVADPVGVAEVMVERAVLLHRDDDVLERRVGGLRGSRSADGRPRRPVRPARRRDPGDAGPLEERPPAEAPAREWRCPRFGGIGHRPGGQDARLGRWHGGLLSRRRGRGGWRSHGTNPPDQGKRWLRPRRPLSLRGEGERAAAGPSIPSCAGRVKNA